MAVAALPWWLTQIPQIFTDFVDFVDCVDSTQISMD